MKVKELIKVLERFPQDWEVNIGDLFDDTISYDVKGVFKCSEYDDMNYPLSEFVQIMPMPIFIDINDWYCTNDFFKMYGDEEWYNTIDTWEMNEYSENGGFNWMPRELLKTFEVKLNEKGVLYPFRQTYSIRKEIGLD